MANKKKEPLQKHVGKRLEIHPACDLWMQGAMYGRVERVKDDILFVRMDHPQVKNLVKLTMDLVGKWL